MQRHYGDQLPTRDRLCEACQKILHFHKAANLHIPRNKKGRYGVPDSAQERHVHHAKETDMHESAQNGCLVCSVLWRRWVTADPKDASPPPSPEGSDLWYGGDYVEEGEEEEEEAQEGFSHVEIDGTMDNGYDVQFEMKTAEKETRSGPSEREGESILAPLADAQLPFHITDFRSSTASPACLALARHWLKQCQAKHESCQSSVEEPYRPTRLLKVEKDPSGYRIRLVPRATDPSVIQYVTLSHCWGLVQPLTLKIENLEEFKKEIEYQALPKTFRDAAFVTHQLGYQYLWIDSLCIIQNSDEDWNKEAADMMQVYRHCTLNLSAQDSKNSSEGLFFPHTMKDVKPLVWQSKCEGTADRFFYLCLTAFWDDKVNGGILSSRAWVMQERLLAPRVLHFGKRQLFWECQELRGCESAPGGVGSGMPSEFIPPNLPKQIALGWHFAYKNFKPKERGLSNRGLRSLPIGNDPLDIFDHIWKELVSTYSRCSLTNSSDKLIAISGLAQTLRLEYGGEYCAGLWKSMMIGQLTWEVQKGAKRSHVYRAPSWSWASIDGAVRFRVGYTQSHYIDQASLESVKITPLTGSTTGSLEHGALRLKGQIYPVTVSHGECGHSNSDTELDMNLEFESAASQLHVHSKVTLDIRPTFEVRTLYCMPVRASTPDNDPRYNPFWWSLLLQPTSRDDKVYERLGSVVTNVIRHDVPADVHSAHVLGFRINIRKFEDEPNFRLYSGHKDRYPERVLYANTEINDKYPEQIITIV